MAAVAGCAMAEGTVHHAGTSTNSQRLIMLPPADLGFLDASLLQVADGFAFKAARDAARNWAAIPILRNGRGPYEAERCCRRESFAQALCTGLGTG